MSARHVMILASAGSGKTYALTNRFVSLLARGAKPERIIALTFTRKAAGEFFDEILRKLARAASEPDFAARLAREIDQPSFGPTEYRALLRAVVDAMHLLRLGTFDGFFARIARVFPLELGLSGEFELLQEHAARLERRRVLQRMFARLPGGLDAAQTEFIEAFKRATFGAEEKKLGARLDEFIDEHQGTFLTAPAAELWGSAERIWPHGCEWLATHPKALEDAARDLQASLRRRPVTERQLARWEAFFAALPQTIAGAALPAPVEYLLKNALAVWPELRRGAAELVVERKKLALTPDECGDLRTVIRHLVGAEVKRRLAATRGIHAVLRGYEKLYDELVRRTGRLTFGDVQRLLQPDHAERVLSAGGASAPDDRLLIDYRLDAQFDHWLLDEFQDTSFGQWSVLKNLIDEVVQDPQGQRTFFCVGDVKQAIFTWREGDPRLFREIFNHYNAAAPGTLAEEQLFASWRSAPAIIELVNAVFGREDVLAHLFPGAASETWSQEWRAHASARPELTGHAAWLHADNEAERLALTVRLLREMAPLERGLDCAILTQTNAMATALADYLRKNDIPALAESDLHVCVDNPLGAALLALVQAAAHPGDKLAQEHWRMTPLREVLRAEGVTSSEDLTSRLLAQIHDEGFEPALQFWLRRLEPTLAPTDEFSRERGRQFLAAAALFDQTRSRDVAEFVAFMERHTTRESEIAGVVRVMTIHKSKGLGFDVVLLPDLEGQRIDQRRTGLAVQRGLDRAVEWVLDLPPKLFHSQDETLGAHVRVAEAESCYEALSLFYVAMTRAKRAMYLVTSAPGTSESRNYPKLLAAALGGESGLVHVGGLSCSGGWSSGAANWFESIRPRSAAPVSEFQLRPLDLRTVRRSIRRPARRPSTPAAWAGGLAPLFALEDDAADLGSEVHALFAEIEYVSESDASRIAAQWRARGRAGVEAAACLVTPSLAELWRRRAGREVWRERSFEVVLDGVWVSGVFDRVLVDRAAGESPRVTVVDFKTDRAASLRDAPAIIARHAAQLSAYRRIAAVLAGVAESAVGCELVLTRIQQRVEVPSPGT